eukprot:c23653_g1_i1 orf=384-2570(-)
MWVSLCSCMQAFARGSSPLWRIWRISEVGSSSSSGIKSLTQAAFRPCFTFSTGAMDKGVEEARFGSWKSPLTADLVASSGKQLGGMAVDGEGCLIWLESRPTDAGRAVLVRGPIGSVTAARDITPADFYVRTLVHEYGGGAFTVDGDIAVFSNYTDQRLYVQSIKEDSQPTPLTPDYGESLVRYADGVVDRRLNRYVAVREDHRLKGKEVVNEIVAIQLHEDRITEPEVLVSGNDFYSFPRLSPDFCKLAWIEWCHPNMPWDRAQLWVGEVSSDGKIRNKRCLAGGEKSIVEAPTEPRWSPQGELFFVSDRDNGFWNLYKWVEIEDKAHPLYTLNAEFTRPAWEFGNSSYDFIKQKTNEHYNSVVCSYRQLGSSYAAILNPFSGSLSQINLPFTDIHDMLSWGDCLFLECASPSQPVCIIKVNLEKHSDGEIEYSVVWSSSSLDISKFGPYLSTPTIIEFPTKVPGQTAFANFYPPYNCDYRAPEGEKPPLLVRSHGGPTSETRTSLNLGIQYWTSRGWAFADVNYGGSTGYGREYRERLYGSWGIVDVEDCCSCAEFLVATGKVDAQRLCIDGRSAGGYTTLATLVFQNTFKAGASLYGIGDLLLLMEDIPKFESHCVSSLVGDDHQIIYDRSPINFIDKLSCPIIVFQGLEDKVVPPKQARDIYEAVKAKGIPVALIEYDGEQHGFRKAENVKYTLEQEMVFFARLIGNFKVADNIKPTHIENFDC